MHELNIKNGLIVSGSVAVTGSAIVGEMRTADNVSLDYSAPSAIIVGKTPGDAAGVPTAREPVLVLHRRSAAGASAPEQVNFELKKYEVSGYGKTQLDIRLLDKGSQDGDLTDVISLQSSGRVGIGTTNPGAPIEIHSPSASVAIPNTELISRLSREVGPGKPGSAMDILLGTYGTDPALAQTRVDIKLNDLGSGAPDTTIMTLQGDGKIGIGNTSPSHSLDIAGELNVTGSVFVTGSLHLSTPLSVASGGTGATSSVGAITALLPSQTGQSGKVLQTDGFTSSWSAAPDSINAQTASYVTLAQSASYATLSQTASFATLSQTASFSALSQTSSYSELALTASYAMNAAEGGFALTGSTNVFKQIQIISGGLAISASWDGLTISTTGGQKVVAGYDVGYNNYAGLDDTPGITDLGGGTMSFDGNGSIRLYATTNASGRIVHAYMGAQQVTIPVNTLCYVNVHRVSDRVAEYVVTTDPDDRNGSDKVIFLTTFWSGPGNRIQYVLRGELGRGMPNKQMLRTVALEEMRRETGLQLSVSGSSKVIEMTGGKVWVGINRKTFPDIKSDVGFGTMAIAYHSASVWEFSLTTTASSGLYDDGTDVRALSSGSYNVLWVYKFVADTATGSGVYLLGPQSSSLAIAEAAGPVTPPAWIDKMAILSGKVIFASGSSTPYSVVSAFTTTFATTPIITHHDLTGLADDDHKQYLLLFGRGTQTVLDNVHFAGNIEADQVVVGTGSLALPNAPMHIGGDVNSYFQVDVQNTNTGSSASTDWILGNDKETDSTHYLDLGINSSTYSDPAFEYGGPNDSYLIAQTASLLIGLMDPGENDGIIFHVGGSGSLGHFAKLTPDKRMSLNKSGSLANATLDVSGSVLITGSLGVTGTIDGVVTTASFVATSSWAVRSTFASTASYVAWSNVNEATTDTFAGTASYASTARTASYIVTAQTASYVTSTQTASYVLNAVTASYVATTQTASFVATASWALNAVSASYVSGQSVTSSYALTASYVVTAFTASFVATASWARNAISASYAPGSSIPAGTVSSSAQIVAGLVSQQVSAASFTGSLLGTASYALSASYAPGSSISSSYAATASWSAFALTASYVSGQSVTSSYALTASYVVSAITASFVATASWASNTVSVQTASYIVTAQTASFVTLAQSASFVATASWASNVVTASYITTAQTASFVTLAQTASFVTLAQTASFVTTAQTASFVATSSWALNSRTASYVDFTNIASKPAGLISSSAQFSATDNFTVGQITASSMRVTTLFVTTVTSSIDYVSGSSVFGINSGSTHQFTGSVLMSGSLTVVGPITGTITTASYVLSAVTASYVTTAQTASYVATAQTASYITTASWASNALTASFVTLAQTASFVTLAQSANTASFVTLAQTASFVTLAQTASYVTTAQTASFIATASWAANAVTASYVATAQTASFVATASWSPSLFGSVTASRCIYVNKGGSDITGNGTVEKPFLTLSASMEAIPPTGSLPTSSWAVYVGPGIYSEATVLWKPWVTLCGNSTEATALSYAATNVTLGGIADVNTFWPDFLTSKYIFKNVDVNFGAFSPSTPNSPNGQIMLFDNSTCGGLFFGATTDIRLTNNSILNGTVRFGNLTAYNSHIQVLTDGIANGSTFNLNSCYVNDGVTWTSTGVATLNATNCRFGSITISGSVVANFDVASYPSGSITIGGTPTINAGKVFAYSMSASLANITAITGSMFGTASYATLAQTASYIATASWASNSVTASYVTTAQTASYVTLAQTASFVTLSQTASFVTTAQTASFVATASWASNATTASYVTTAQTASFVTTAQTASFVATSSWATSAVTASYVTLTQTASFVTLAQSASYVLTAQTASFIATASWSSRAVTASWAVAALSASYAPGSPSISASYATTASYAETASYAVVTSGTASSAVSAQTASFVATASWALNAITASYAASATATPSPGTVSSSAQIVAGLVTQQINATGYSGSFTGSFIGSLTGTSSYATLAATSTTASFVTLAQTASFVTSAQSAITASYVTLAQTASFVTLAQSSNTASFVTLAQTASFVTTAQSAITASFITTAQTASYVVTATTASYVLNAQTASFIATASWASNAVSVSTASYVALAQTASYVLNAQTASFIATASWASNVTTAQTASFVATASWASNAVSVLTASFVTLAQTASFVTLAQSSNTASFVTLAQSASYVLTAQTASFIATASWAANVTSAQTASFVATASWASNAVTVLTASFITTAQTASYVLNAQTASFIATASWAANVTTAQTASFVATASWASNAVTVQTASFVTLAQTASYVTTSQTASYVALAQTASFITTAQTASFIATASWALRAVSASYAPGSPSVSASYADTASWSAFSLTASYASTATATPSPGTVSSSAQIVAGLAGQQINATGYTGSFTGSFTGSGFVRDYTFLLGMGTPATVGVNKTNTLIVSRNGYIVKAFAVAKTGPTGANFVVDINKNGSTIWATQANRLTIPAASTAAVQTSFDTTALAETDQLTIDIDQVGSSVAGQDVTIVLTCLLRNI